jgi:hypothetical protein
MTACRRAGRPRYWPLEAQWKPLASSSSARLMTPPGYGSGKCETVADFARDHIEVITDCPKCGLQMAVDLALVDAGGPALLPPAIIAAFVRPPPVCRYAPGDPLK